MNSSKQVVTLIKTFGPRKDGVGYNTESHIIQSFGSVGKVVKFIVLLRKEYRKGIYNISNDNSGLIY